MSESVRPRLRGVSHQHAFWCAAGAGAVLVAMSRTAGAALATAIYAGSLAAMFGVSATYHRLARSPRARAFWQRADHATIFVFVAGTYAPICLVALGGAVGARLFLLVAIGALAGVLQAVLWPRAPRVVTAGLYLLLGWALVAYWDAVASRLGAVPQTLLVVGGALYTTGAVVYALRRPDPWPRWFGYHEVFHVLVIAASACHFAAVLVLVR
jgi:hemolysin III